MNAVQRSRGDSATARAAYRACCVIECEREGRTHDYRRKQGLDHAEIVLPANAPAWAKDRARLWNAAELRERNGKRGPNANAFKANAQTARDFLFSFADELSAEGRRNVARAVAAHLVKAHGVAVDFAIHAPGKDGDERNHHCHMMFTTRRMAAKGLGEKTREWDERGKDGGPENSLAKQLRALVARLQNEQLAAEGKADIAQVEHRTFKERGKPQKPMQHRGPAQTHTLRKQQRQERDAWQQVVESAQRNRHAGELAALKARQAFERERKQALLSERARMEARAIRRELAAARAADRAPQGLRRLFLIVTGLARREEFNRLARQSLRIMDADAKMAALRQSIRAERQAFREDQARERTALTDRQRSEERQLRQAVQHRIHADRAAEVQHRKELKLGHAQIIVIPSGRSRGMELH